MASRRRGIGVGAVHKKQDIQAKFQAKGDQLAGDQLQQFSQQLETFTAKLEAMDYSVDRKLNSNLVRQIWKEKTASKGFWAEKLGVGDFYYELAVKIIEVCLSTSYINGGLITVDDLRNRLMRSRSKTRKEPISHDDVIRAVKKLKVLGHGFELIALGGGRFLVQSVPGELSMDDARVLQLAEESGGYVSQELVADHLRWDEQRISRVLERLLKDGRAWIDNQPTDSTLHYYFPALFLEQFTHINGSGSASGSNSSNY